ncbi:MAG TPA: aminotransferase class V-fold PLP-dependent enzyme [Candidatus Acidoferrum sp.]|jgi:selenocysteine lyase/cysteine desulfurase
MATSPSPIAPPTSHTEWREHWFDNEEAIYLNLAGQSPMPKVSFRAVQASLEWKKFPQRIPDTAFFDAPNRIRTSIAQLINAQPQDIALTTGASSGMSGIAYGLNWKPGDEVITATGEFPLQYATWKPMEEREGIVLKVVKPRDRFLDADDIIAALTPRTRLVSISQVRFDNGVLIDAARIGAACHAQGALLLVDASQACGAVPIDVQAMNIDFLVSAGYKFLLGPFGTGFCWGRPDLVAAMRPGPFYWMAAKGMEHSFDNMNMANPKPADGAKRWDAAETANYFNHAALDASLEFVLQVGAPNALDHTHKLIDQLFESLPKDRCIPASPLDREHRGPYACFTARTPDKTVALYEKLRKENIIVSLREGNIRVSPYLFNTERDIDRLISVITT